MKTLTNTTNEKRGAMSVKTRRYAMLVLSIASIVLLFLLFFLKFYSYSYELQNEGPSFFLERVNKTVNAIGIFQGSDNGMVWATFVGVFLAFVGGIAHFIKSLRAFFASEEKQSQASRKLLTYVAVATGLFFLISVIYCFTQSTSSKSYSPASWIPFALSLALIIVHAFFSCTEEEKRNRQRKSRASSFLGAEFFIYGAIVVALTISAALSDLLSVTFQPSWVFQDILINGFDAITDSSSAGSGTFVAFVVTLVLMVSITLFVFSTAAFISRSRFFYKITLAEILFGMVCTFSFAMLGKYYELVQNLNERGLAPWLEEYVGTGNLETSFTYEAKSGTLWFFIGVAAVCALALIRSPYTKATARLADASVAPKAGILPANEKATASGVSAPVAAPSAQGFAATAAAPASKTVDAAPVLADPCPAFTELDAKKEQYAVALAEAKESAQENATLPSLVQYAVDYARDSRLHLFYTAEDIATFVAGLGATRLTILQGMSGTGKTSLPKIFAETFFGVCDIIEIESSWRDKNELLGYYNEFSRTYTPKKFTQALYRAALNPETITLIVLDEMNLSRIEYYFSDFLSLMENEEDKREIKLLNVGLFRTEVDGARQAYSALVDGHTLKIPPNVWFIGTANRDESTFEISDKVYDRAHTMNFNKRAPRVEVRSEPLPRRYVSTEQFLQLLKEAKEANRFDAASDPLVKEVETLVAPYNISFGNRIANQIEAFVSIYCACFAHPESVRQNAIETILLSKVVAKLEQKSIEDKEALAAEFAKRGLHRCSEFILKLSEE